jgi:hypothetical protein
METPGSLPNLSVKMHQDGAQGPTFSTSSLLEAIRSQENRESAALSQALTKQTQDIGPSRKLPRPEMQLSLAAPVLCDPLPLSHRHPS